MEAAARSLGEVAETLVATHQSWSESLLRLPRAEDYEPLAAPLREFARVSPALAETFGSVVRSVAPLPELVARLSETADKLRALRPASPTVSASDALAPALAEAADRLGAARLAIRGALDSLPRDPAYATFAAHLKELATVSPSLMEWLRQVPTLSLPLGEAVASLGQAAQDLEQAERSARRALAGSPGPRSSRVAR
jgi:ABC-type transporter Mla subunit MlaD